MKLKDTPKGYGIAKAIIRNLQRGHSVAVDLCDGSEQLPVLGAIYTTETGWRVIVQGEKAKFDTAEERITGVHTTLVRKQ